MQINDHPGVLRSDTYAWQTFIIVTAIVVVAMILAGSTIIASVPWFAVVANTIPVIVFGVTFYAGVTIAGLVSYLLVLRALR